MYQLSVHGYLFWLLLPSVYPIEMYWMTFWIGSVPKKKDDSKDPTGVFKMVDQLLPEKPRLKPQDRARDIEAVKMMCLQDRSQRIAPVTWIGSVTRKWKISVAAMMFHSGS